MVKGDCFLCLGATQRTLYYITDVRGNKCDALSININSTQVQGLDYDSEYDIDLADDIIYMPSSMYSTIKQLMLDCVEDIHKILQSEAVDEDYEIKANSKYTDGGHVYTMKYLADERWHYNLFRVEEENISPDWTGDGNVDSLHSHLRPITESTYKKVLERFNSMQAQIAKHLEDKQ